MRFLLLLSAFSVLPAAACISLLIIPSQAKNSRRTANPLVAGTGRLARMPDYIWVPLQQAVSLSEVSSRLALAAADLSELNGIPAKQKLRPGTWIVLPASSRLIASRELSLQLVNLRVTAPLIAPPPIISNIIVKSGNPLRSVSLGHNLSKTPLPRLDPVLRLSRLATNSEGRTSNVASLPLVRSPQNRALIQPSLLSPVAENLSQSSVNFIWPAKGIFISGYGWRWGRMHKGIDIANSVGTPILASKGGIVSYANWSGGYGYLVELSHADGSSTRYAHNSRLLVREGQIVPQGTEISLMGSTGRATGPHLHFEVRRSSGAAVDPMQVLPPNRV
ncbi:hypothetical protein OMCYN_01409 [cyanobiont of Ornithocercus magnificus]|nr:hypothetical protein OMCYN_01409 [cyanobiont of Ornithocercus magnificus]